MIPNNTLKIKQFKTFPIADGMLWNLILKAN